MTGCRLCPARDCNFYLGFCMTRVNAYVSDAEAPLFAYSAAAGIGGVVEGPPRDDPRWGTYRVASHPGDEAI